MGWVLDDAHFDVSVAHHLEQLDGETITEGRIHFTPAVDSFISASGTWQFAWPSSVIGGADIGFAVADTRTKEIVVNESAHGGNVGIGPPFGNLNIQGSGLLSAGTEYLIYYSASVHHFDPPPGTSGEASGEIHFEIMPVPEPASLALILPAALTLCRRRARSAQIFTKH